MADNNNIPFDRIKAALDSVKIINELNSQEKKYTGKLDPPNINEILDINMRHLSVEKDKGGFSEENNALISNAIIIADEYIINNPDNGGGGVNPNVTYFVDCGQGFYFAIDFSPQKGPSKIGEVWSVSAKGYKGCATIVPQSDKQVIPYSSGMAQSLFVNCETCKQSIG